MAELLAVGKEFKSFEALQEAVHKYEQTCFAQLSRTDSRTIENEESRRNAKLFNPNIKYSFVTFTCAFGGKPYVSRSTGIRNSKPRIKCNCPVILKCFASSDGQKLVVRHSALDCHNHDTSEESFKALPRGRLLDEETEQEIFNLIEAHENKKLARKLVKEKLIEETGRDITYKDIQNIEKRMSKKRDQGERNGQSEDEESNASMASDQEEEAMGDQQENNEHDKNNEDDTVKENADEASHDKKSSKQVEDQKGKPSKVQVTPKKRSKMATVSPSTQTRSSGRPRREIREPTRFRDPEVTKSSSVLKRRASESENSWEESDSGSENIKKETPPSRKGRKPAAKRGRKPARATEATSEEGSETEQNAPKKEGRPSTEEAKKGKSEENSSLANRQLDLEERRLKIQEEMLTLQRQSMLLLKNVVEKLDRVEANQKGDMSSNLNEVPAADSKEMPATDLKEIPAANIPEVDEEKSKE